MDPSGTPYEELFCSGSQPRGFAVLGDSISAHFHIPGETTISTYNNLFCILIIFKII